MKSRRIWLIGGTSESVEIAGAIAPAGIPCTITVTTTTAQSLYPQTPNLRVRVGRIKTSQMGQFCLQEWIVAVVDASHPHAVEISQGAIATAQAYHLPYLRYERPSLENNNPNVINLASLDSLISGNYLAQQRVMLTLGYKALPQFKSWQERATLFARILPAVNSLEVAIEAGFTPDRLIALRPPISASLEKALWYQWGISLVVTKASGTVGGEDIKKSVATELGIPLIVIARPKVTYPQQTSEICEVLFFCRQYL